MLKRIVAGLGAVLAAVTLVAPARAQQQGFEKFFGASYAIILMRTTQSDALGIAGPGTVEADVEATVTTVADGKPAVDVPVTFDAHDGPITQTVNTNANGQSVGNLTVYCTRPQTLNITASVQDGNHLDEAMVAFQVFGGPVTTWGGRLGNPTTDMYMDCETAPTLICSATGGQPDGTTYDWDVPIGSDKASIDGPIMGGIVEVMPENPSGLEGDIELRLIYTFHDVSVTACVWLTVHEPFAPFSNWVLQPDQSYYDDQVQLYVFKRYNLYTIESQLGLIIPYPEWREDITPGDDSFYQHWITTPFDTPGDENGHVWDLFTNMIFEERLQQCVLMGEVPADLSQDVYVGGCMLWRNRRIDNVVQNVPSVSLTAQN